jgi:hypothetical protein
VIASGPPAGNQVNVVSPGTMNGLVYPHNANAAILVNPYSFALQAATGGM